MIRFDTNTRAAVAAAKAYLWLTGVSNGRREGRRKEQPPVTNNIRCAHTHTRMHEGLSDGQCRSHKVADQYSGSPARRESK